MRSLLMVPAHRRSCLEKAHSLGADALVFDLEDSVPEEHKDDALNQLRHFLHYGKTGVPVFVRVNPSRVVKEVQTLNGFVTGFMVPKARWSGDVHAAVQPFPTLLVIETAMAILNLERLMCLPNVIGGVFGVGDYSADMGVIDRPWVGSVNSRFAYAKQRLATVARAFGKMALDTSFFVKGPRAVEETERQWSETASWGFTGASPIHPSHIPTANKVFSPSNVEIGWSRSVLSETEVRKREVYADVEGFLVGPPQVRQAKEVLNGFHGRDDG